MDYGSFFEAAARELISRGWAEPKSNSIIEGIPFEFHITKHHISFWQACFTVSRDFLDQNVFQKYESLYNVLNEKARSWTWANFTILVVVAEKGVSQEVAGKVDRYSAGMAFTKAGGCLLCIADVPRKAVYMKTPGMPLPVRAISREFKDSINRAMTQAAPSAPIPSPPPPAPTCPTCGGPLTYIQQYQRWYCYKEQKYQEPS